jgi:hypothetical protein
MATARSLKHGVSGQVQSPTKPARAPIAYFWQAIVRRMSRSPECQGSSRRARSCNELPGSLAVHREAGPSMSLIRSKNSYQRERRRHGSESRTGFVVTTLSPMPEVADVRGGLAFSRPQIRRHRGGLWRARIERRIQRQAPSAVTASGSGAAASAVRRRKRDKGGAPLQCSTFILCRRFS